MNAIVARRFRDVQEMHINSLLILAVQETGGMTFRDVHLHSESRMMVVPFLSRFDKLERVIFRGKGEDGNELESFYPAGARFSGRGMLGYPRGTPRERMLSLLDNLSSAFHCGAMPRNLEISGLCCPNCRISHRGARNSCETCLRACKHFPLQSVLSFECRGSSLAMQDPGECTDWTCASKGLSLKASLKAALVVARCSDLMNVL